MTLFGFSRCRSGNSPHAPRPVRGMYRSNLRRLRIGFDVGTRDGLSHVIAGSRALHQALDRNGIAHQLEEYDGDHVDHVPDRLAQRALPFLSQALDRGAVGPPRLEQAARRARLEARRASGRIRPLPWACRPAGIKTCACGTLLQTFCEPRRRR